jgi:predicted TIM-barrel fold metal-dependent hydrolase
VIEPADLFAKRVPPSLRDRAPRLVAWRDGSAWMVEGSDPVPLPPSAATASAYRPAGGENGPREAITFGEVLPGLYDPAERIKLQDADSVGAEVLYPLPGLWDAVKRLEDAEVSLTCVQAYNDWIADVTAHAPDRLIGLGKIPPTSREDAQAELARCVDDLGLRGVILDTWPGGSRVPGDPDDDPFWEKVNQSRVPVSIHYALGRDASTEPPAMVGPGVNPPMADTTSPLLATGLFDRCPDVRLVFAHGDAGWVFHWLEQMDTNYLRHRHLQTQRLPFADPNSLPSEYIRRHFWFTFFHYDRPAVKNRHRIGLAHLMWGSGLPLDSADWPDDRQHAVHVTEELPAADRRALLAENTARLYRLPGYEEGFTADAVGDFEVLVHL